MLEMEEILSREEIAGRVRELGRMISLEYAGRPLVLLGILNGAFIFMADLARAISIPLEIDFIRVASYGSGSCSSGKVHLSKDTELSLAGKAVLLVEDIVDTGKTLNWLQRHVAKKQAASVRVCALIDKRERRECAVTVDYAGFVLNEGFLIGYGLDYAEGYRQLPAISKITGGL